MIGYIREDGLYVRKIKPRTESPVFGSGLRVIVSKGVCFIQNEANVTQMVFASLPAAVRVLPKLFEKTKIEYIS